MVTKKITIIVQARMNATRLPRKVLRQLKGESVLNHIVTRLKMVVNCDDIIIATSTKDDDDLIEDECKKISVKCFRGSEEDVLSRFYHAADMYNVTHIMRFCADNPLLDPNILDKLCDYYIKGNYNYVQMEKYPIGIGGEIFTFDSLKEAYENAKEKRQREHVTPYIQENTSSKGVMISDKDYSKYRFTLDTEQDWQFINEVYNQLYKGNHNFFIDDVIKLLNSNAELYNINKDVVQVKV